MSRFADPTAIRTVDLGPCECPDAPHKRDEANIRAELSASEVARLIEVINNADKDGASALIADAIVDWNLLGPDGEPWPPSAESVDALKHATTALIAAALAEVVTESVKVPNASGAPSRDSSRRSASRRPTTTPAPTT